MTAKFDEFTFRDIKSRHAELASITHSEERNKAQLSKYRFIDLFAGVGGIRQGIETIGGGCVFSSEIDIHAQHTYYSNYGTVPFGDINEISASDVPNHDILCGGFPCQPFSHIGLRQGFEHPTQGTMFHEVLRIISDHKPAVVFLENVPGIVNHDDGKTLKVILDSLAELNYSCKFDILNAADFGIPQNRKRFYLVCFKDDKAAEAFKFPSPPNIYTDVGDILEDDPKGYSISKHLQSSYLFKKDDGRPIVINKNTKGQSKTLVSTYHKIQRLTGTFVEGGETGLRLLSEKECKALMGFPDDFFFPVSRTQMYRQMGNSVVIPVIEEIAKGIDAALDFTNFNSTSRAA